MYKHILIPTDGSDLSRKAVLYGVNLARATGAKVTGLHVTAPFHALSVDPMMVTDTPSEYKAQTLALSGKALEEVAMAAQAAGVACEIVREESEQPYRAIIDAALNNKCDLIVMASHGRRGMGAILLGSETVKVLTHSVIPVLVYR
jgi:nucleotide-binding universal stress UspA family protein